MYEEEKLEYFVDKENEKRIKENQTDFIRKFENGYIGKLCKLYWRVTKANKEWENDSDKYIQRINANVTSSVIKTMVVKLRCIKFRITNRSKVSDTGKRNDYLSIAAIIKNEGQYIREWVEFHILSGVDRFYIFDNESTDNTVEILQPYIDRGVVIYFYYPGSKAQVCAYNDAIRLCRGKSKWLAMIDADEFLFPAERNNLKEVLKEYEQYPAVGVNWVVYGPCGHEQRVEGTIISNYYMTFQDRNNELNCRIKSIVQPIKTMCYCSPHFGIYKHGEMAVDENKEVISGGALYVEEGRACTYRNSIKKLRINHYWTKSLEELKEKCQRGYADGSVNPEYEKILARLDFPLMEDREIERFVRIQKIGDK